MKITKEIELEFNNILNNKKVYPVYQPIVSLKTGEILGYEALSRIESDCNLFGVEEMFIIAENLNCVWELEALCRKKAIEHATNNPFGKKLFINVDPKVLRDKLFKKGMTQKYLNHFGLNSNDIIFEITEHSSIENPHLFQDVIENYREEGFEIAIDDFGSGYAGLNRVSSVKPEYIKIDIELIKNINKNKYNQSIVESICILCKNAGIHIIAEGIETKEELEKIISFGIEYGQGYYLQKPQTKSTCIPFPIKQEIVNFHKKYTILYKTPSLNEKISVITDKTCSITDKQTIAEMQSLFDNNKKLRQICIIDKDEKPLAIITKKSISTLLADVTISLTTISNFIQKMDNNHPLTVEYDTPIRIAAKMALTRPSETIYDSIIVTKNNKFHGIVTIKKLLETAITQ